MTRSESTATQLKKAGAIKSPSADELRRAEAGEEWDGKKEGGGTWSVKKNGADSYTVKC